jgi:hypothetical protein
MTNYINKYLKYKKKYLLLKQIGGSKLEVIDNNNLDVINYDKIGIPGKISENEINIKRELDYTQNIEIIEYYLNSNIFPPNFLLGGNKSNVLLQFSRKIMSNAFASLYKQENGNICLTKEKEFIKKYIDVFYNLCNSKYETLEKGDPVGNLFPKMEKNFLLYRAEYVDSYVDFKAQRTYYAPFSATYNFEFAFGWIDCNVVYIIYVPHNCDYFYLQDQSQKEVTLQQGKLEYIKKYYVILDKIKKLIVEYNFTALDKDEVKELLPEKCQSR